MVLKTSLSELDEELQNTVVIDNLKLDRFMKEYSKLDSISHIVDCDMGARYDVVDMLQYMNQERRKGIERLAEIMNSKGTLTRAIGGHRNPYTLSIVYDPVYTDICEIDFDNKCIYIYSKLERISKYGDVRYSSTMETIDLLESDLFEMESRGEHSTMLESLLKTQKENAQKRLKDISDYNRLLGDIRSEVNSSISYMVNTYGYSVVNSIDEN